MHNDYLDPDRYLYNEDEEGWTGDCDPPEYGWHLYRNDDGHERLLGILQHHDGQDVMGCDMDEWMRENGHYGNQNADNFDWEGDSEGVAIMAKHQGLPDFRFEWKEISQANAKAEPLRTNDDE